MRLIIIIFALVTLCFKESNALSDKIAYLSQDNNSDFVNNFHYLISGVKHLSDFLLNDTSKISLEIPERYKKICNEDCEIVAPHLSITNTSTDTSINYAQVYFYSGYVAGQDFLIATELHGISATFDTITGTLKLSGVASIKQYQEVLSSICYLNSANPANQGEKVVYFVLGNAIFNPLNGHYYQLISEPLSTNWTDARIRSSNSYYFGLHGYLVTITDSIENTLIHNLINSDTWLGASDSLQENVWRWVTGCEGLEEDGKGRHFYTNDSYYNNWDVNEPDNVLGIEHYAHSRPNGTWNDVAWYNTYPYIIEYGCMPNDPEINIRDYVILQFGTSVEQNIAISICEGQVYTLPSGNQASSSGLYSDTLVSALGCDSILHINLIVLEGMDHFLDFMITSEPMDEISIGNEVALTIINPVSGAEYEWFYNGVSLGILGPSITTLVKEESNDFRVRMILPVGDICGGEGNSSIKGKMSSIKFPNAFTPNGDLKNDVFQAVVGDGVKILEITVVNRWGVVVYRQSGNTGWDGRFNGKECLSDTYIYKIRYKLSAMSEEQEEKGTVTLIR